MSNGIAITADVELFTDGTTARLTHNSTTTINFNPSEVLGVMGSLRFALGLNADVFEVAETEDGPCIELDRQGMQAMLDTLESVRAAQDGDDEPAWDF